MLCWNFFKLLFKILVNEKVLFYLDCLSNELIKNKNIFKFKHVLLNFRIKYVVFA